MNAGARRGTKNPELLLPRGRQEDARGPVLAYVSDIRPLKYGDHLLPQGVEVPGAAEWPRIESWVDARRVRPVYEGEDFTTYEDFLKMVDYGKEVARVATVPAEDTTEEE